MGVGAGVGLRPLCLVPLCVCVLCVCGGGGVGGGVRVSVRVGGVPKPRSGVNTAGWVAVKSGGKRPMWCWRSKIDGPRGGPRGQGEENGQREGVDFFIMACTGDKRDGVNELADGFGTRWVRNGSTLCETTGQRVGLKFREW